MKWITKQIAIPIVIGVSVTGVCVGALYLLYRQDDNNPKSLRSPPRKLMITIEVKVPKAFVPAIIGRGGTTIKEMESRSSTKIHFSEDNLESEERICCIQGPPENIAFAEQMIKHLIENQPVIEVYELLAPQKFCSSLLTNRRIEVLQSYANAKIIMEKSYSSDPDAKRRVIIKGTAEQIATALTEIQDKLKEFNDTEEKIKVGQSSRSPRGKVSPKSTNVNVANGNHSNGGCPVIPDGTTEVYVSAAETPSQFWVQVVGPGTLALDDLVKAMTDYYNQAESRELHTLLHITEGETVAARFGFDNCWYRAEITSTMGSGKFEVFFLDYGDHTVINVTDILELRTDFLSLRFQAIEFSLADVKPTGDEWSQEACDRFEELVHCAEWKVLTAPIRGFKERAVGKGNSRKEGSPIPCVDLYDRNDNLELNVGKQLVHENLAVSIDDSWSAASSTLSLSKRTSHDCSPSPTPLRSPLPTRSSKEFVRVHVTPEKLQPRPIEEINLITPKRLTTDIEEVDLVTPARNEAAPKWNSKTAPVPGGYEDDDSGDDDSLEMF